MEHFNTLDTAYGASRGTVGKYVIGFVVSLVTTFAAYIVVTSHTFSLASTITLVVALALAQLLVQLIYFLHLGRSSHGRWNAVALLFTVTIVVILVVGTLWVMSNLTDRTMTPMRGDGTVNVYNAY